MIDQFTVKFGGGTITWTPSSGLSTHLSTAPLLVQMGVQDATAEPLRLIAGLLETALSSGANGLQLIEDLNAALREVAQRALIRSGD